MLAGVVDTSWSITRARLLPVSVVAGDRQIACVAFMLMKQAAMLHEQYGRAWPAPNDYLVQSGDSLGCRWGPLVSSAMASGCRLLSCRHTTLIVSKRVYVQPPPPQNPRMLHT
jgi:hypothetical protein